MWLTQCLSTATITATELQKASVVALSAQTAKICSDREHTASCCRTHELSLNSNHQPSLHTCGHAHRVAKTDCQHHRLGSLADLSNWPKSEAMTTGQKNLVNVDASCVACMDSQTYFSFIDGWPQGLCLKASCGFVSKKCTLKSSG